MSKPLLGLILGAALGLVDGLTSYLYPEARPLLTGILIGSTFKGLLVGVIVGFVARKFKSIPLGVGLGLGLQLIICYLIAANPDPGFTRHYYLEIMLPGALVGAIVGYAIQVYGGSPMPATSR